MVMMVLLSFYRMTEYKSDKLKIIEVFKGRQEFIFYLRLKVIVSKIVIKQKPTSIRSVILVGSSVDGN